MTLRIGIAGLGNVGCGLVELLQTQNTLRLNGKLEISGVCAKNKTRKRPVDVSQYHWFDNPLELAQHPQIDAFVELIGGTAEPSLNAIKTALSRKKAVITANKALIAEHGMELAKLAEKNQTPLLFEAAVAGATPIIRAMRQSLPGTTATRISGILNGTCNYILTQMRISGQSYAKCLEKAQQQGYAEANPKLDVSGADTAYKISILASIAFKARPGFNQSSIIGIENISADDISAAENMGFRIRLVGQAQKINAGILCQVEPMLVSQSHPLFPIENSLNTVIIHTEKAGQLHFTGPGAGAGPTASAVIADCASLLHERFLPPYGIPSDNLTETLIQNGKNKAAWFIRLNFADKSGAIASIYNILAENSVSIDAINQDFAGDAGKTPIALVTHPCKRHKAMAALQQISSLPDCLHTPSLIKMDP